MISIVIPIYNSSPYLDDCLASLSKQSFGDFEVLCVDDGSTDDSLEKCRRWHEQDSRFKFFSQQNQGVSIARNLALEQAQGEYICFVDSDDVVAPDYLAHLKDLSKDGGFPICGYTRTLTELGKDKGTLSHYEARDYIRRIVYESINHPNLWMMLFKRSIIQEQHIRFTVGCVRNEDTEFFVKYLYYEREVLVSGYQGYYYRPNPQSVMQSPITVRSLSSIEASRRMNEFLFEKGVIEDDGIVLSNGVLNYAFNISRRKGRALYAYLHGHYDVKYAMRKMLTFPRLSKKMVALCYLVLGRNLFFNLVGLF